MTELQVCMEFMSLFWVACSRHQPDRSINHGGSGDGKTCPPNEKNPMFGLLNTCLTTWNITFLLCVYIKQKLKNFQYKKRRSCNRKNVQYSPKWFSKKDMLICRSKNICIHVLVNMFFIVVFRCMSISFFKYVQSITAQFI